MQLTFGFLNEKITILVVGSGGREHALCWKLQQSGKIGRIFCAPGNAGIARIATPVSIPPHDIQALLDFAIEQKVDLTVVGPELPLTLGIVDLFVSKGLRIFGPTKDASALESSKVFAKEFMQRHAIPTASFETYDAYAEAVDFVKAGVLDFPLVIKADGLAAGKGVLIARNEGEAEQGLAKVMQEKVFGKAGSRVVIEEFLQGEEASFMVFADGEHFVPLAPSRDHKQVFDDDKGPNTGGMGAYSTDDIISKSARKAVIDRIVKPTLNGIAQEGAPYKGVLYFGLMLTPAGPKLLEYNVRLGDPETQAVLPRMESSLVQVIEAVIEGNLETIEVEWSPRVTTCVVLASGGYPETFETGKLISGLEMAEEAKDIFVFHAGTRGDGDKFLTSGGRVLSVTGIGNDLSDAVIKAYEAINKINFEGMHYRRDIGAKGLARFEAP